MNTPELITPPAYLPAGVFPPFTSVPSPFGRTSLTPERAQEVVERAQFGFTAYRGVATHRGPSDPGDLGIGTYFSTQREIAKCYGHVSTHTIKLANPLVLSRDDAYALIADRWTTCNGRDLDRLEGAIAATEHMQEAGYDGLIAVNPDGGDWEVVVFPK